MQLKLSKSVVLAALGTSSAAAFTTLPPQKAVRPASLTQLNGYLDNLSKELYAEDSSPDPEAESRDATKMAKDLIQNAGPSTFADYVDFADEFDGGDGQMGVAGDGNKQLEKMDNTPQFAKSKMMSAKNAWGTDTGYADTLRSQNPKMDTARAQQLENWANQQEVRAKNQQLKAMSDSFDQQQTSAEENWRQLAKFGVERNEEFDLDEKFGPVVPGDSIDGVIELTSPVNRVATFDLPLRNPYMGFADFRAAFTADTPMDWSVEPNEGSLMQKEDTNFVVKFKPQGMGVVEGYLVIETEDFKKTFKVVGST
ncbi:hypothetical protein ACHAWO_004553 [Cyclotella atomus]|uniref:Plastid lipid-associated protein/fibrillin conserved domain-containing protein n=1 Tax=Cyclotella atomus TaxID=382360 RepID=A0ABD3NHT6_9STRA